MNNPPRHETTATPRGHGSVTTARGLTLSPHLCWAYHDKAEFRARTLEYAADGITAGQYVEYIGEGSAEALSAEIAALDPSGPLREALSTGQAGIRPASDYHRFRGDGTVDPAAAVAARAAATEKALADGYTGLRIIADCTPAVRTPAQREAFARYEYLLDQQMAVLPVSALCAYNAAELGPDAVAELACLHPFISPGAAPFQLYASPGAGFALAGEIDRSCASLFTDTLSRTTPPEGPHLLIDARPLSFIDHRSLFALNDHAVSLHRNVIFRTNSPAIAKVARLLSLPALRVEAPPR